MAKPRCVIKARIVVSAPSVAGRAGNDRAGDTVQHRVRDGLHGVGCEQCSLVAQLVRDGFQSALEQADKALVLKALRSSVGRFHCSPERLTGG